MKYNFQGMKIFMYLRILWSSQICNHWYKKRDVLFMFQDIFAAGSEASATAMEWAISQTIKNPKIMKRAQDEVRSIFNDKGNVDESRLHELKYLRAIIEEILRLHPSVPLLLPRECKNYR